MTRMTREFSLVLLGAGMLTAAYVLWPEQDLDAKAEEQAQKRVGGGGSTGRAHTFLWIHAGGLGARSSRAMAMSAGSSGSVSRGGFGGTAARAGGGGSS